MQTQTTGAPAAPAPAFRLTTRLASSGFLNASGFLNYLIAMAQADISESVMLFAAAWPECPALAVTGVLTKRVKYRTEPSGEEGIEDTVVIEVPMDYSPSIVDDLEQTKGSRKGRRN